MTESAAAGTPAGPDTVRAAKEPSWPAASAVLVAICLHVILPGQLTLSPNWVLPALEALILVTLLVKVPRRHPDEWRWTRPAAMTLNGLVTLANAIALQRLVVHLLDGSAAGGLSGGDLLGSAVVIWFTNVLIFALWYWELDGGGPGARRGPDRPLPEFLFPQIDNPRVAPPGWAPRFVDYLYVSITNTTAFSPTDTMPLTVTAKGLMALQAFSSMLILGLVVARAVNVIS
jgi:hypothetical protein